MEYKLVLLGIGGVGKSALIQQFFSRKFVDYYDPTIEDNYRKQVSVDEEAAMLDILDTAGQDDFYSLRESYMRFGEGFLLVSDITSRKSFDELSIIARNILRTKGREFVPIVFIGNKADLGEHRQITSKEGKEVATQFGCEYIETSATSFDSCEAAFRAIIRLIRQVRNGAIGGGSRSGTDRPRNDGSTSSGSSTGSGTTKTGMRNLCKLL